MAEKTATPKEYELDNKEMDSNSAENPHSPTGARMHSPSDKPDTTKRRVPIHLRVSTGSCHDLCKYGKSHYPDEITKLPFRKRNSKSLPNVPLKTILSEPSQATASKSSSNDPKSVNTMASGVQNTKNASLPNISPRQSALSGNKTCSPKLSRSVSETPEIIKREILLIPSANVDAPVEEGSSNGNKESRTDKKMSDQSANRSSSEKPKSIKPKMLIAPGRNMMSSVASAEKASESPTAFVSPKFYLGKTASSLAREEAGKVKLSLSSPVKHRSGTEKSNGEGLEKTLHVIKTETEKARKTGGVQQSSPPSRSIGIHDIKTEAESNASSSTWLPVSSSRAKSLSLSSRTKSLSQSSRQEKDEGKEIQNSASIKIEENHARAKSQSSSSHKDVDDEMIDHSNNEAASEIEYHDTDPSSSSSHEEDDEEEEMYPSSFASSSVSSLEENDEEVNGELVSDKTISMDKGKSRMSVRKSQLVRSEDKNNHSDSAVKLKFRRGKVIDIQAENNVPKRLKFRRARNDDKTNKTDDFAPDGKKSIVTETGNVKPGSPSKRTLRKAGSFVSDNKKKTMDVKPGMPNMSLRKSRSVASEDKYCSPVSLSRREKTVDPQTENNSPTRLKFARGRVSRVEDAKSDSLRKNIKRAEDDNEVAGDESPRNVVLKLTEVQMKNNGQVLLNNVIKETASKLVESRKSKVKALVGAFETVISLHETRPAASSNAVG